MLQSKLLMILAGVLILTMGFAGCEYQRVGKLQAEVKVANEKVEGLLTSVDSKDHVIAKFMAANDLLMKASKDHDKAMSAAAVVAASLEKEIEDARKRAKAKESADRAIPDCDKLLRTDLNICPAHAATIRGH